MKKAPILIALLLGAGLFQARATTTEISLLPSYPGGAGIAGTQGNFAPGFDSGSWNYDQVTGKAEVYIDPAALFSGAVTVGDIASISYWTNKPMTASNVDWSLYIYTAPTGSGDTGSFYHSRLISEPYLSPNGASYTPNAWTQWDSNPTTGLRVYDTARDGGVYGTYTDPFLNDAFNGSVTYPNSTMHDYTGETVKYFSLQTGSAWSTGFPGLMDGLTITLKNGDIGIVNFEAVPETSTWVAGALAAIALAFFGVRRRNAALG
jgi:hypothetical protein